MGHYHYKGERGAKTGSCIEADLVLPRFVIECAVRLHGSLVSSLVRKVRDTDVEIVRVEVGRADGFEKQEVVWFAVGVYEKGRRE